jgi:hypothetical protein
MPFLERGKLYRFKGQGWLQKTEEASLEGSLIGLIEADSVLLFIGQSLSTPFTYKVIHDDQVGWIYAYPEAFEELSHAEPKESTGEK